MFESTKDLLELSINQSAYAIKAVARRAGPSMGNDETRIRNGWKKAKYHVEVYIMLKSVKRYLSIQRTGHYRPQGWVKADKSILNFGSPRPPVVTLPLGLATCCNLDSASRNASIKVRRLVSSPVVYLAWDILNTNDQNSKTSRPTDRWGIWTQETNLAPMWINN